MGHANKLTVIKETDAIIYYIDRSDDQQSYLIKELKTPELEEEILDYFSNEYKISQSFID